ncbi:hypothetical protein XMIN_300 [Xanthomonas citri pv. mangiferaeindicae LMG 941]|nr:hypothetical protein XMIN_300 [Xanthomonas citri pv. mangiferaeindicae LMG 941]
MLSPSVGLVVWSNGALQAGTMSLRGLIVRARYRTDRPAPAWRRTCRALVGETESG